MKPRLAVFDMIGTTVEAGPEVSDAFREAFGQIGIALTEETVGGVRGRSKKEAVADLVRTHSPSGTDHEAIADEIYTAFRAILRTRYESGSRPIPGARSTLEALGHRGIEIVLTTGLDRENAGQIVRGLGWESLPLRGVITGDDVERGRPAPDLIYAAMALVGERDPGAVLAVGDTVSDLQAAARAHAGWSVGVLSGAHTREQLQDHPHSVLLESVAELPGWLDREGLLR